MSTQSRYAEIRKFCQENANRARAQKYKRYFTEGYDPYGLNKELMHTQRDAWLQEFRKELDFEGFLRLGDLLVASGKYEEASFAILFVAAFKEHFTPKTLERLGQWLETGFRNWAHTDVFCGEVLSHFLVRGIVPVAAMSEWRNSRSKWKRRAVPVTLISALKTDIRAESLVEFVEPMMLDSERVVQQGLGWFLREAWKKRPPVVEKFLLRWKDSCPRLIVQYATEKMAASKKARFKKTK